MMVKILYTFNILKVNESLELEEHYYTLKQKISLLFNI